MRDVCDKFVNVQKHKTRNLIFAICEKKSFKLESKTLKTVELNIKKENTRLIFLCFAKTNCVYLVKWELFYHILNGM